MTLGTEISLGLNLKWKQKENKIDVERMTYWMMSQKS